MPRCKKPRGCEIQDLARDQKINFQVRAFLRKKNLEQHAGYEKICEKILSEAELDDPLLLEEMEGRFSKYLAFKRQSRRADGNRE